MKNFAFVFARGGSKGVPNKNIKKLCGKPLIGYSIELAKEVKSIEKVFVSTENRKIAEVAKDFGAEIIPRPVALAQDDSPEWLAWQHAIKWVKDLGENFDTFISIPTTSPLRNENDIIKCLEAFDKNTDAVIAIAEALRNPYFNMVKRDNNGFLKVVLEPEFKITRRQDTPKIFDVTTVAYVSRPDYIINCKNLFEGNVKGVEISAARALDIDTELDFEIAEALMSRKLRLDKDFK